MKTERLSIARRQIGKDWLIAITVSLAAHLILLSVLLSSGLGKSDLITGDGLGEIGAMTVSLVGKGPAANPQQTDSEAQSAEDPARALLDRLTPDPGTPKLSPVASSEPPRATLDELLAESPENKVDENSQQGRGAANGRMSTRAASTAGGAAASAGRLWAVVEPCWRRMPQSRGAQVRLQVELDGLGRLARPPRVLRTHEMTLNHEQLLAETQAIEALSACLPKAKGLALDGWHILNFRDP